MPGGLLAARGEEQTNTVRISVSKDQSIEIKISAFGTTLPTSQHSTEKQSLLSYLYYPGIVR